MFGFNFSVVKSIEKELAEHPEYQASLKSHLEGKGPVSDYFGPLALGGEDRLNALNIYQSFVDAVKNTTDQQQKAFSTFLKEYISMDQSSKTTFEEVMTTDMTREKCWSIWRNQSISQKAIEMVKLVNLLDEEFGIKTCLANVIELKNTVKLSKYWNQHPALENLNTLFPVDQKFIDVLQTMLTDTKDLTRVSVQHLLKTLRLFVHDNLKFVEIFETIQTLHGINLEPVWKMIKQFLEFSDENRKNYIEMNFEDVSLKSLGDFFKTIQKVPNVAKEFEETFMKPNEQWNKEQMEKLLDLLKVLEKSKYSEEVDHAFDENVSEEEYLLDPKLLDFNFEVIQAIENNLMEHPDLESSLMSQLKNEQVKNYFTRIDKKYRAHVLLNYATFFIPMVKSYTKSQLDAISKFFKEYPSFKNSNKVSFGNVLTTNATRYECWDLWKSQKVSNEIEKMVKLVKMFEKEFGIKTCFSKVIDIRDIAQLSEFWNRISDFKQDYLTSMVPVNEIFKDTLQVMLTDTKNPSRSSYRHFLKTVRGSVNTRMDSLYQFISRVFVLHSSNYEPLWIAINQFFEYSEDQRKEYIDLHFADSNSSLAQFFKTILPTSADDYDVSLLKPYDQWNDEQMEGIYHIVFEIYWKQYELGDEKSQRTLEMVERVLEDNVSYKECEDAWNFKKDDDFAKKLRKVIGYLDDNFGKMSCETMPPLPSPGKVNLPV
ncbi:hypothetical protein CAEBREN_04380 [Caenorhabditis brenneri]|uniref:Uncharacterized protein n=1 Tax=Caenorhabditis brenneri TaxID=135651 RepID=G0N2E0_CAEBE|nr:hypothetical protein CAEBREN_04380 [Caenorhabditis brenneri]